MALSRGMGGASLADGIRVVAVNPGLIATERMFVMLKGRAKDKFGDESRWEEMMPSDPPPGTPEQVADLVVYLASPRAGHVTGTVVTIDGGQAHK
jgi:NAD(P)-dependent dehydrogenase (short-subunit alcohol dehydrogenase family)